MPTLLDELKATARGAAILQDWLGGGAEPVPAAEARARAAVCVACPENEPGGWWEHAKSTIAGAIREHVAVKRALKLETVYDHRLGTCNVCKCNNPLQVWVPINHVAAHTPPEVTAKFPVGCWKRKELSS